MKEIIEKLQLLEDNILDNKIEVAHLFEADEDEEEQPQADKAKGLRVNAQVLKIISEKTGIEPQKLKLTLSKTLREQNVSNEGRQHIANMLKLILRQQPAFLNRMK